MRFSCSLLCVMLAYNALSVLAESPAANAALLGRELIKGAIVTGEQRAGAAPQYAVAGTQEPAGVPPEKVIFEIGSISKVFTGLLLAQAVTEGRLTLDTTLHGLLGQKLAFADPQVAAITLKQLATHTSGLPSLPDNFRASGQTKAYADPYADYDRDRLFSYLKTARLAGKPPFKASYSNLAVGLLGDLLSQVYAKPWNELVQERITQPLGMLDTTVLLTKEQAKRFAPGYRANDEPASQWNFQALMGCGALRSTSSDLLVFGGALTAPEKTPFKTAIALLMHPQNRESATTETCLCLVRSVRNGKTIYWHNGKTGGFHSMLQVEPDTKTVQVVLSNNVDARVDEVVQGVRPCPPESAVYEGLYKVTPTINYTVRWREGELQFQITHQSFLSMIPDKAPDTFLLKNVPAQLVFGREAGVIKSVTLTQGGKNYQGVRQP